MPDPPCAERLRLADAVVRAVQRAYAAHSSYYLAIKNKREPIAELFALEDARTVESRAVAALKRHRKEHGC
jgi:hypothetical protein